MPDVNEENLNMGGVHQGHPGWSCQPDEQGKCTKCGKVTEVAVETLKAP